MLSLDTRLLCFGKSESQVGSYRCKQEEASLGVHVCHLIDGRVLIK